MYYLIHFSPQSHGHKYAKFKNLPVRIHTDDDIVYIHDIFLPYIQPYSKRLRGSPALMYSAAGGISGSGLLLK